MVQEAFLSAYQSLDGFKGDSQFFTWLYRIAVNTAISHKRKRRITLRIENRNGEAPLDPADPDLLYDDVTLIDHAWTRPWSVTRSFRRAARPVWTEYLCGENNNLVLAPDGRRAVSASDDQMLRL